MTGAALAPAADNLSVVFECHAHLCALPSRWVRRLLLADEGRFVRAGLPAGAPLGGRQLLEVSGQRFAAWDFGELVELPPLSASWALLDLPHRGAVLPLALRIGRCRAVARVPTLARLPEGLWRRRRAAFSAAFALTAPGVAARVGLFLDPTRLWTEAELEASLSTLLRGAAE
ncbi:MAG: hypothetical protein QM756_08960 [Polyangiaceae bacterium]